MDDELSRDRMTPAGAFAWSFLSDRVMGGVSTGAAAFDDEAIRLTGEVSTKNRGGFVQVRAGIDAPWPEDAKGLILRVRGTPQRYFVHLRTATTTRPWQFHQAAFQATEDWRDVRLPFAEFVPQGGAHPASVHPERVRSIGLAAYGRDHEADVSLAALGLF